MNIDNIIDTLRPKALLLTALLAGTILVSFISSCTDDFPYSNYGEYSEEDVIKVPISVSVEPIQSENPESRAITYLDPTDEETKIHDF